jgi:hypothetical protein
LMHQDVGGVDFLRHVVDLAWPSLRPGGPFRPRIRKQILDGEMRERYTYRTKHIYGWVEDMPSR